MRKRWPGPRTRSRDYRNHHPLRAERAPGLGKFAGFGGAVSRLAQFASQGNRQTQVTVSLTYHPPGGLLSHAAARLFGADPKARMSDILNTTCLAGGVRDGIGREGRRGLLGSGLLGSSLLARLIGKQPAAYPVDLDGISCASGKGASICA